MLTISEYRQKIKNLMGRIADVKEKCVREGRDLTEGELADCKRYLREAERFDETIDELERQAKFEKRIHRPNEPEQKPNPGAISTTEHRVGGLVGPGGDKSYRSLFNGGEHYTFEGQDMRFFEAVFSGRAHPHLNRGMTIGVPSDGGFLVPSELSERIHAVSLENEIVMPGAFVHPMTTSELKLPGLDIGSHGSNLYGGFTASYKEETGTMSAANPKTRRMQLNAHKLTGFLRLSNELAADAVGGENAIINICGKGLGWYRDKAFLKGNGAGEPLGLLNASCLIAQDKESGQTASTIVYENLVKMMSRMFAGSFANSVWICHQTTIPQLLGLSVAVGTGGSHYPVLSESNGQWRMLTRPVVFTEKTEPLGSQGDVVLADLSQYVIGLRQGMRIDTSQHVYFTTDELAARLIERHDGQPLWNEALTLEDGSTTVSPFVTLAERT